MAFQQTSGYGSRVAEYDYRYSGPMPSSLHSIPLGNGDFGVNFWMEGETLYLLLSKTDAFNEWCDLLKLGLVKITCDSGVLQNPEFHLSLYDGVLNLRTDGASAYCFAGKEGVSLCFETRQDAAFTAEIVNYRANSLKMPFETVGFCSAMPYGHPELEQSADCCGRLLENTVYQYHRNEWSCYPYSLELQGLKGFDGPAPPPSRRFRFCARRRKRAGGSR